VLSGPEIQEALRKFAAKWSTYQGSERAEAQTFLNELFACYGTDRSEVGALFEDFKSSAGFMDLHWPGALIVEMKKPGLPLANAREQRQRYWLESSDSAHGIPAARLVIACNFHEFEVWEPGRFPNEPRISFTLAELADHYDALLFLQSETIEPVFAEHRRALTAEAAQHIADLYQSLTDRAAAPIDEIQRFTMQTVWALFAEDLGMLEGYPLQATVDDLLSQSSPDSAKDIGYLYELLNQKGNHKRQGRYTGTRYVNGDLFKKPAKVFLNRSELLHLKKAAEFDWRAVDPTIFGSLLEGVLGEERRERLGAHYTHESDIMKIVTPTIIRPWRERITATASASEARSLLDELCAFRVLDPACGCGNFLYVAYRELRSLEQEIKQRIVTLAAESGTPAPSTSGVFYPLANIHGIDIEGVAVLIARVTLWMGHRQMVDRFGEAEPVLPLVDLSGIRVGDALRTDWPEADAIIGNPPFIGDRKIRAQLGSAYLDWLKKAFPVGVVDFSAYWFRLAAERLKPGQRAGLVSTNTLRENKHRVASLDYIVARGGVITDAVSSQRWPGDAKVHVSLTNWTQSPIDRPTNFYLDGIPVSGITSQLRAGEALWEPRPLPANRHRSYLGCQPTGDGFFLDAEAAERLQLEVVNQNRIRRFLTAQDIADDPNQSPGRWIIDFGTDSLESANRSPALLDIVRRKVRPERLGKGRHFERLWWQFAWPRPEMRAKISLLTRYAVAGAHGKRLLISWQEPSTLPSNADAVFCFDDDHSMGVLLSRIHDTWAWARASTLETRLRYTPSSVFETFPWPEPNAGQKDAISLAARDLFGRRSELWPRAQHRPDQALQPHGRWRLHRPARIAPQARRGGGRRVWLVGIHRPRWARDRSPPHRTQPADQRGRAQLPPLRDCRTHPVALAPLLHKNTSDQVSTEILVRGGFRLWMSGAPDAIEVWKSRRQHPPA
jgi:hypothetical protein